MKKTAFCFDLDGTVTKQEILPLISKKAGIHEEISLLTQITLDGQIPFETSFKLRVKLLSTILISSVREIVKKVIIDQNIANFIKQNSDHCYIVTGNLDVWIKELIEEELKCKSFSSKADYSGDHLHGISNILNKGDAIQTLRGKYSNIVAIGDSMNDCSMFKKANIGIAFGGVHNPVDSLIKLSDYIVYDSKSLIHLLENIKHES